MVRGHVMIRVPSGPAVSRAMNRTIILGCTLLIALSGCMPKGAETAAPSTGATARTPVGSRGRGPPEISWDTDRDRVFAEFLRDKSGGMVRKAAVGIERRGEVRIAARPLGRPGRHPAPDQEHHGRRSQGLPRPADHPVGLRPATATRSSRPATAPGGRPVPDRPRRRGRRVGRRTPSSGAAPADPLARERRDRGRPPVRGMGRGARPRVSSAMSRPTSSGTAGSGSA